MQPKPLTAVLLISTHFETRIEIDDTQTPVAVHIEIRECGQTRLLDDPQTITSGPVPSAANDSEDELNAFMDAISRTKVDHLSMAVTRAYEVIASSNEEFRNDDGCPNALLISDHLADGAKDSHGKVITGMASSTLRKLYRRGRELLDEERGTSNQK